MKYKDDNYAPKCYRCGKRGHYQRVCRVKLEEAKCGLLVPHNQRLPEWTKMVQINSKAIKALLDTGCTKTLLHPRCVIQIRLLGMGHSLPDHFIQTNLLPCCECRAGDRGESHKNTHGSVGAHWQDMLM